MVNVVINILKKAEPVDTWCTILSFDHDNRFVVRETVHFTRAFDLNVHSLMSYVYVLCPCYNLYPISMCRCICAAVKRGYLADDRNRNEIL